MMLTSRQWEISVATCWQYCVFAKFDR